MRQVYGTTFYQPAELDSTHMMFHAPTLPKSVRVMGPKPANELAVSKIMNYENCNFEINDNRRLPLTIKIRDGIHRSCLRSSD
jgi:hypothetical protein